MEENENVKVTIEAGDNYENLEDEFFIVSNTKNTCICGNTDLKTMCSTLVGVFESFGEMILENYTKSNQNNGSEITMLEELFKLVSDEAIKDIKENHLDYLLKDSLYKELKNLKKDKEDIDGSDIMNIVNSILKDNNIDAEPVVIDFGALAKGNNTEE